VKSCIALNEFVPHLPPELRDGLEAALKQSELSPELHRSVSTAGLDETDERTFVGYASTRTLDRDGEVVIPDGVQLDQFRKAPVVLFGHKWSEPPIGKDLFIAADGYGLKTKSLMATTPLAEDLWTLVKGGFLRTSSIGYIPLTWVTPNDKSYGSLMDAARAWPEWRKSSEPRAFVTKSLLLEHSLVSCPANAEALITAVKQLNLSELGKRLHTDVTPPPAAPPAPKTFTPRLIKTADQLAIEMQAEITHLVHEEIQRRMGRV